MEYQLSAKAMVMTSGSSMGTQAKYFDAPYWYKCNRNGYEGLAEELVSKVLDCSNLTNYVAYESCKVNGKSGCRSLNFLQPGERYLSFDRLYTMLTGQNLMNDIRVKRTAEERISYVLAFIKDTTSLDLTDYLANTLLLDALTLNNDRHFNNLGLIINEETEEVREAPIFDNGDCLLSSFAKFHEDSMEENIARSVAFPFSANAYAQARVLPASLQLNYHKLYAMLEQEPPSRALEALYYQLEQYRSLIPEWNMQRQEPDDLEL